MLNHNTENDEVETIQMEEISKNRELSMEELDEFTPKMNVTLPDQPQKQQEDITQLIPDEQYLNFIKEILTDIKDEKRQVSDYVDSFAEMVINSGDATTSSKEAFVNLVKIKVDLNDKMLKVADLMTRLKMKNTYANSGAHINAVQQNNYNMTAQENTDFNRKELIKVINQAKKHKKE